MASRNPVLSLAGSKPATEIVPPSRRRRPPMHSTMVVFPAPLGPRMPKISPSSTAKPTPLTTARSPYTFRNPQTSMMDMQ